tara:strand:+ start:474 stop:671 length:198 start_codon:yes stop_codon:yes gene_type:complete
LETDQKTIKNLFQPSIFFEKTPLEIHKIMKIHSVPFCSRKNFLQKRDIMISMKFVVLQNLDEFGS